MEFCELLQRMVEADPDEADPDETEPTSDETSTNIPDDYEDQVMAIMASALAAGLSEVDERIGFGDKPIESVDDAVKMVVHIITMLRVTKRDVLRKALRKYERLGHDRFRRDYRRSLAKEYERNV